MPLILKSVPFVVLIALLAGCDKRAEATPQAAETSDKETTQATASASSAPTSPQDWVTLGAGAPELRQIAIEPLRAVPVSSDEVTAPAKIEVNPNRVGHAVLPVPGRIVRVMVKLGDAVKAGQPVVVIESPSVGEAEAAYLQSQSGVRQAELAVAKAEADLARETDLFEHQAVAQKDVLAARTASELAKASLDQARSIKEQAQRRLELLGLKPGQTQQQVTVTAPISGKVLEINVVEGELHNEINAPLLTIADLSRVWASSEVPESAIRFCRVGGIADLELIAFPGETFHAQVARIADTVDGDTRTIKVTAELDNPGGRLRPQMYGRLKYAASVGPALWLPETAIVQMNGNNLVFVEQEPGKFRVVKIELGNRHDTGYVIRSGLTAGQRVVTDGAIYLKANL